MTIHRFPVVFSSGGTPLVGVLHRNVSDITTKQPAVICTGSWLTVKEQMPAVYAGRLAELGYTAFTFDFAGFGESGGAPRQFELPQRKIQDIASAADFVSTLSCVVTNGIGHLGVCASAQYALAALAHGASIDSFVSVAGWYHDAGSVAPFYGGAEGVEKRLEWASNALRTYVRTGTVEMVPAYEAGNERAGMFFEAPYYGLASRGAVPAWKNEMATLSWFPFLSFDGLSAASRVDKPVLMVHSEECVFPENAKRVYDALRGRKSKLWSEGSQTDFYDQRSQVDEAINAADQHFRETLPRNAG